MKLSINIIAVGVIGMVTVFLLELFGVGMFKFFEPMKENVRREIFENTKSYIHGKIQDLAKYCGEYNKAKSIEDKQIIKMIVCSQFANFNIAKIKSYKLQQFLITMRGY